ncbi:MAG: single-stranded-DNA-specific exonuclease RecJ [Planctomycetaceae bacterium]|nr:single-stranded-DNA-specific exonuclease RecJ [Planctomycetaceae bacterium]
MPKRWRIHPHDGDHIARLQQSAGVSAVVAQLLICRGIRDPGAAREFLDPKLSDLRDPNLLPDCSTAAERLHEAIKARRSITVYGDYDVDGITGTAILLKCLRLLGAEVNYYVPSRLDEGYGMNHEAVRSLAERGSQVLVTVDCGIASVAEAQTAREAGIDLIVTDHHEPAERLPEASAIVHPNLPGRDYPFAGLSGSGVALKLAWALCQRASGAKRVSPHMRDFLVSAVGLAAMGTVADVVPLVDENRVLVRHGLVSLKDKPGLGLEALMRITELNTKPALDAEDIGFVLGPRLNAAGRLGQAQLAIELLVTDRPDRAEELARYLHGLNESRQTLERSIYLAANKQAKEQYNPAEDAALVLADRGWHPGVIGIVAGRIAEKYQRPTILIAQDQLGIKPGVGSCRSVPGFDLHAALSRCSEYLIGHGGHAAAAGLTIDDRQVDEFRHAFCEVVEQEITEELRIAELKIDAEAPLNAFTLRVVDQIEQLGPFGQANLRPLLCTSGVSLAEPPRPMGSGGHHLALKLTQHNVTLRAVAFGGGEWAEEIAAAGRPLDVAFRPVINTFRGRRNVELHLVDWRTP